jgi:hypothetical protein
MRRYWGQEVLQFSLRSVDQADARACGLALISCPFTIESNEGNVFLVPEGVELPAFFGY